MYCDDCGSQLNPNGICPVCGWQKPQTNINQPNIPKHPYGQPNPQMQQFGQPNMQGQQFNQPNIQGQQFNQPNMQVPPYRQPNMQWQGYQQQNQTRPNTPTPPVKKSKLPIIMIICASIAVIALIIILFVTKPWEVKDYTNDDDNKTTEEIITETEEPTTEPPSTEAPPTNITPGSKTIMMYIVGSDLESKYSAASEEFEEILSSGFNEEVINLVIYTGGCKDWQTDEVSDGHNSTFIVKNGELVLLEKDSQKNMGDADTLSDFINYCYDNYPAEQYGLILWNHGGGAFSGYGYDELTNDCLSLMEMTNALDDTPFNGSEKFEWIGFDACLMASIEIADAFAPYSKYLIASQEPEPCWGWDYAFLADADTANTGAEIGTLIVDSYIETTTENFNYSIFSYMDITLSVLDLDKVDEAETALNDLFALANQDLSTSTYHEFANQRSRVKQIASQYSGEQSYDLVDLVDLCDVMATKYPAETGALKSALSDMIVYQDSNVKKTYGVSIYYPYNAKQYSQYFIPMFKTFDFAPNYASYIENFGSMLTGTQVATADWNPETMMPVSNGNLTFSLTLTPEQAAETQKVYYVISRADTQNPGDYVFVSMSNQVTFDDTTKVTANFDGQVIYMQNDTTGLTSEIMYTEQEATEEYTRYLISSILYNDDIQGEDAMYTYFVLETTPDNLQGNILGAYPIANLVTGDQNEIFPDRYEIDINDYKNVAFGYFTHEFTSTEDLTNFNESDWSDVDLYYNYQPISEGFSPVMGEMRPEFPYYGMFIFEDTQGNRHCSNLVQIQ